MGPQIDTPIISLVYLVTADISGSSPQSSIWFSEDVTVIIVTAADNFA